MIEMLGLIKISPIIHQASNYEKQLNCKEQERSLFLLGDKTAPIQVFWLLSRLGSSSSLCSSERQIRQAPLAPNPCPLFLYFPLTILASHVKL